MNKLQRFVIIRRHSKGQIDVIGTNSGQAFVAAAAEKHARNLTSMLGGSFHVQEIQPMEEYIRPPEEV